MVSQASRHGSIKFLANIAGIQQQTFANRPDQTNPWGSVNWESYDTGQKDAIFLGDKLKDLFGR